MRSKRETQLEQAIAGLLQHINGNAQQPTREELLEQVTGMLLNVVSSPESNTYQKLHAAGLLLKATKQSDPAS